MTDGIAAMATRYQRELDLVDEHQRGLVRALIEAVYLEGRRDALLWLDTSTVAPGAAREGS